MNSPYIPVTLSNSEEISNYKNANQVDAFSHQLKELFIIQNPTYSGNKQEGFESQDYTDFLAKNEQNFVHVYYSWNNTLVKTFPKDEYLALKTNRNQDLITNEEQKRLRDFTVLVLGLSVGSNIAFVLTQAGISNKIVLVDYDELDTTNLNRILAGAHQIGLPKSVIAARRIYEDNPFAEVVILNEKGTKDNIGKILFENKINCIIEEIDDLPAKIVVRNLALENKIPVIMVTDNGDGIVLHVERYDNGYTKIFDKPIEYWQDFGSKPLTREMAGKMIIEDIVGGPQNVDPKMMKSVQRVFNKELVSWSQLGSAAILGGVFATVALKKIALGETTQPYYVTHINPLTDL